MSDTQITPNETPDGEARPWHGVTNPFEALHAWVTKELAAIKGTDNPAMVAMQTKVTALEAEIAAMKAREAKAVSDISPAPAQPAGAQVARPAVATPVPPTPATPPAAAAV
jgi:hypothetical protein